MPDFETDMHLLFPEEVPLDSDKKITHNLISDKTKRDMIFNRSSYEDDSYDYWDMRWK